VILITPNDDRHHRKSNSLKFKGKKEACTAGPVCLPKLRLAKRPGRRVSEALGRRVFDRGRQLGGATSG